MDNYKVNEIFYSLQGEGRWTGRAAVFLRMSGCNLACPFCDTDFRHGELMSQQAIIERCKMIGGDCKFVVITGGEPTLQVDDCLINALHQEGYYVAMETNGTRPYPSQVDWVTCSPKVSFTTHADLHITHANELKLIYDDEHEVSDLGVIADYKYLQPCDVGIPQRNALILAHCIDYIKQHPEWQLSLQTHKLLGIQ